MDLMCSWNRCRRLWKFFCRFLVRSQILLGARKLLNHSRCFSRPYRLFRWQEPFTSGQCWSVLLQCRHSPCILSISLEIWTKMQSSTRITDISRCLSSLKIGEDGSTLWVQRCCWLCTISLEASRWRSCKRRRLILGREFSPSELLRKKK